MPDLTRMFAIARKETIQLRRDTRSLILAFLLPVLLLVLFGYAITWDVTDIRTAVVDQSRSRESRELLDAFKASGRFRIVGTPERTAAIASLIDRNQIQLALVIPPDFSASLGAIPPAQVQAIVDGSDANTATIVLAYTQAIVQSYSTRVQLRGQRLRAPLTVATRVWYNEELLSRNMIVPGLVAVIMMIIAALLTSMTVAREWERGTMEQLISTPVKAGELILGKFIPYFVIGMIDMLIVVIMGQFIFHVPLRGNLAELFILAGIFLTGMLCWGILISILTRNQFIASQVSFITTFLPAFILSGFTFPIGNMPWPIQLITTLIPARYFVSILKGVYLKGVGLDVLWPDALFLVLFSAVMIMLAKTKFRKRVA